MRAEAPHRRRARAPAKPGGRDIEPTRGGRNPLGELRVPSALDPDDPFRPLAAGRSDQSGPSSLRRERLHLPLSGEVAPVRKEEKRLLPLPGDTVKIAVLHQVGGGGYPVGFDRRGESGPPPSRPRLRTGASEDSAGRPRIPAARKPQEPGHGIVADERSKVDFVHRRRGPGGRVRQGKSQGRMGQLHPVDGLRQTALVACAFGSERPSFAVKPDECLGDRERLRGQGDPLGNGRVARCGSDCGVQVPAQLPGTNREGKSGPDPPARRT